MRDAVCGDWRGSTHDGRGVGSRARIRGHDASEPSRDSREVERVSFSSFDVSNMVAKRSEETREKYKTIEEKKKKKKQEKRRNNRGEEAR